MAINKQSYKITGMKQDNLVNTGFSDKFAHEIFNMRLNTIGDYTTGVWTTEKGTKSVNVVKWDNYDWITDKVYYVPSPNPGESSDSTYPYETSDFKPLGQANINNYWILFGTVDNKTTIPYRRDMDVYSVILCLYYSNDLLYGRILYWGDLNFNSSYPIETLSFYENELIQKVYWTDGFNPPRVINIKGAEGLKKGFGEKYTSQFDFVQEVSLDEEVTINKIQASNGMFPPCTVKYALTYYKKYGQETNIVYESPLYYPTLGNRGCSPDEISSDSFKITINHLDLNHNFDYIRLYSIIRTSNNSTPIVRIVEDRYIKNLNTNDSVEFIDSNTKGVIVDPTILNYVGGNNIKVETINQKDNVLFLGGITLTSKSVTSLLSTALPESEEASISRDYNSLLLANNVRFLIKPSDTVATVSMPINSENTDYNYTNQLINGNSYTIKQFKPYEFYRIGIQFQNKWGVWSEVIRLNNGLQCLFEPTTQNKIDWQVPLLEYKLNKDLADFLYKNNYRKARLVCCYTNNSDRSFIAQGVINQTIYNIKELELNDSGAPYAAADWFFRPNNELGGPSDQKKILKNEIQSINDDPDTDNNSTYKTRNDYWTINSPDIELDESIRTLDTKNWRIRWAGDLKSTTRFSSIYLDATSTATDAGGHKGEGLHGYTLVERLENSESHRFDFTYWNDADVYYSITEGEGSRYNYPLIPFQRETSLNNYTKTLYNWQLDDNRTITINQHAKINSKVFSFFTIADLDKYCEVSEELPADAIWYDNYWSDESLKDIQFFDSNEVTPLIINDKVYYGNQNSIANVKSVVDNTIIRDASNYRTFSGSYEINRYDTNNELTNTYYYNYSDNPRPSFIVISSDPVSITYKSTPHIAFYGIPNTGMDMTDNDAYYSYYLVDIYRVTSEAIRFGGINNKNNIYLPCGPAVKINSSNNQDITINGYEGDHYFMRFDCLKTYSYTKEDTNQVIEILSFPCFSRINLDGRYDRNRGKVDNTTVSPVNYNLINMSYTQDDNFFTYTELRDDTIATKADNFPNQITWTKTKMSGEEVDAWTNITMASTFDADGTAGRITKIINQNGRNLTLFQEHGIAQINYNENTALSTETGLPLELSKTGKFTGLTYLTKDYGCQNKWSISQTKNGIIWIDDSRREIVRLGEGIQSLSSLNGFDAFMIQQLPTDFTPWKPSSFNNFVTYYDKLSNDVYFINKYYCLAWNELTNTFTSFYNYENTAYMMNLGSHSFIWKDGFWTAREADTYSTFFSETKDYWITLVCDGLTSDGSAFPADKVFNNIEFRADVYNINEPRGIYNTIPFNTKAAWNGYQFYKEFNDESIRKFNTWRIQLPRATYKDSDGFLISSRDRIRNTFCYIKLKQDQTKNNQTNRVILHDLGVYFDMK